MSKATKGQLTSQAWDWRPSLGSEDSAAYWRWLYKHSPDCRKYPCAEATQAHRLRRLHAAYGRRSGHVQRRRPEPTRRGKWGRL